ncbi:MAG TPA: hypothetical protein VM390_02540 [Acidimicrobiales bacterium]|nr:hypothetical protein [Acidimicrobiales bacterium]
MDRDDVLAAAPHLAGSLLPAVRFATRKEPDAGMDVGHTKLGGAPDLPRGTAWPSWDAPGGEDIVAAHRAGNRGCFRLRSPVPPAE